MALYQPKVLKKNDRLLNRRFANTESVGQRIVAPLEKVALEALAIFYKSPTFLIAVLYWAVPVDGVRKDHDRQPVGRSALALEAFPPYAGDDVAGDAERTHFLNSLVAVEGIARSVTHR
jgi:hypothetical protein